MESYLLTPSNNKLSGIKYYDIYDAARQIVESKINSNEELKQQFENFKSSYHKYSPYLDFLICELGYKFINPFITEEGYLYGMNHELHYVLSPFDPKYKKDMIYPKSDDKSLGIDHFSIDNLDDSIIAPDGTTYTVNRDKGDFHGMYYEIILMNELSKNKQLYKDYNSCMREDSMIYYVINAYFRDRLGYLQVVKYPDSTGHILYNAELKTDYIDGILNGIKEMYPKIGFEQSHIPEEMIESAKTAMKEVNNIYESRRI